MIRLAAFLFGLAGAGALSQFPEFSQQYLQRLAGQVDALELIVKDFDRSATKAGLSRAEALATMTGSEFMELRRADMERTFARYQSLSTDLSRLRDSGPIERVFMPHRFADAELLQKTWADFAPAVPVTLAGFASAGIGFVLGWGGAVGAFALVGMLLRRRYRGA